jgi:hypothetical protein
MRLLPIRTEVRTGKYPQAPAEPPGQLLYIKALYILRNINVSDPFLNRTNLTMADGFVAGDLILIEKGLTFNLDVTCIDDNNVETILLRKNVQVPVLLRLDNLS